MEDEGEISDEIEIVEFDDNVEEPAFEEPTAEPEPEPTEVEQARVFELLFFYQCCHLTGCDTFCMWKDGWKFQTYRSDSSIWGNGLF